VLFTALDSESALDERLVNAIDAIGIEEVWLKFWEKEWNDIIY
jgi:hypothetical protein